MKDILKLTLAPLLTTILAGTYSTPSFAQLESDTFEDDMQRSEATEQEFSASLTGKEVKGKGSVEIAILDKDRFEYSFEFSDNILDRYNLTEAHLNVRDPQLSDDASVVIKIVIGGPIVGGNPCCPIDGTGPDSYTVSDLMGVLKGGTVEDLAEHIQKGHVYVDIYAQQDQLSKPINILNGQLG